MPFNQLLFGHTFQFDNGIHCQQLYLVQTTANLSTSQQRLLDTILQRKQSKATALPYFDVWPRPGWQSPWSSKALDILASCQLPEVVQIEQGCRYFCQLQKVDKHLYFDRMTEQVVGSDNHFSLFEAEKKIEFNPKISCETIADLQSVNRQYGLALSPQELQFLLQHYQTSNSDTTLAELFMFAQVNSEHCRHKIFNADWTIDNKPQTNTLFQLIKQTHNKHPNQVLSAYSDNGAVITGCNGNQLQVNPQNNCYEFAETQIDFVIKVETHNHPTAISPYAGAGTGVGGEIRDEGSVGRGSKPLAGLCGYSVSNLDIEPTKPIDHNTIGYPTRIANAQQIMLEAPIGASNFSNEFGRPNICGYFRSFMQQVGQVWYGYHKPIMIAGGIGTINRELIKKPQVLAGDYLVVLGGPSMAIGVGGGSASSMQAGDNKDELDFTSVQRQNPEMQRRCQEVIDSCNAMGQASPIRSIHDVGAGGLANAVTELVNDSQLGCRVDTNAIDSNSANLNLVELWVNEAQERYIIAVAPSNFALLQSICQRENTNMYKIGVATTEQAIHLQQGDNTTKPLFSMPNAVLFGSASKVQLNIATSKQPPTATPSLAHIDLKTAVQRVISHPSVASKSYLITIGDRSVSGRVVRDQMVGKFQLPVADYGLSCSDYYGFHGSAMAIAERSPVAILNVEASVRMAIAEAITNICGSGIDNLQQIALSANWMGACHNDLALQQLRTAVEATASFVQQIGVNIPVGKDSLSMKTKWSEQQNEHQAIDYNVVAPISLVASAFASVADVRVAKTPALQHNKNSVLILVDTGQTRMGASMLQQCFNVMGGDTPDIAATELIALCNTSLQLLAKGQIQAIHDRSDGGLLTTLVEMAMTIKSGLNIDLSQLLATNELCNERILEVLFNEEIGLVLQANVNDKERLLSQYRNCGLRANVVATIDSTNNVTITAHGNQQLQLSISQLQQWWAQVSYTMQAKRDNPLTSQQEMQQITDDLQGLQQKITDSVHQKLVPNISKKVKPKVAILREQGVNGHLEMAAAFAQAGFDCIDVHTRDIANGFDLSQCVGLAACGGFSYGDVFGAGRGWAQHILSNLQVADSMHKFFQRSDTFSLGVCNGCQMLSQLRAMIPTAEHWPAFLPNVSKRYEARLTTVKIESSASILLQPLAGCYLTIPVSHAEGRVQTDALQSQVCMRYVDNQHRVTESYPFNPNGSVSGVAAVTNGDGRHTIMMPHPERIFRNINVSYSTLNSSQYSPWMAMFNSAYQFVQ